MLALHVVMFCGDIVLVSSFFSLSFGRDACPQPGGRNCSSIMGSQIGCGKGASPSDHGMNLEGVRLLLGSDFRHVVDGVYFGMLLC